jgi:hypothetical protein
VVQSQGALSVFLSVGHAVRFVRQEWRFVLAVAGIASAAHLLSILMLQGASVALFPFISAATHAALIGAVLFGAAAVPGRIFRDTFKLWMAMTLLIIILFIVLFALLMFGMSALLAPYYDALVAAKEDQAANMAILTRAANEQPAAFVGLALLASIVLLYFTSRFYLVAPATLETGRVQLFSSWTQTKGHVLRIVLARLIVLTPAYVLFASIQALAGAALGLGLLMPWDFIEMQTAAQAQPGLYLALLIIEVFLQVAVYAALEAGVAVAIYRSLKSSRAATA